ncbi:MAG: M56 family metallopeptidase [Bacteroidales bacterium]|nr:M56 family metallopeptidase [Clostridium sp.]MCM1204107.1 M56 family metallopeptidase [Bacteroidales bacterium]
MDLENGLLKWIGFFDAACLYYVVQLGRAVIISLGMLALILVFRKTVLKNRIFLRGAVWSILLLAPFMGKLRAIYETKLGVRLLYYWQDICGKHRWIPWIYILGMVFTALWIVGKRRRLKRTVRSMDRTELLGTEIAISDYAVSPFITGVFRPVIVMPEIMLRSMPEKELKVILMHEQLHIRLGHLLYFGLWDILRVLLWINPLLQLCTGLFHSDMEDICDRVTMQKGRNSGYIYGNLLLKSMQMITGKQKGIESSAAFAGERNYRKVKRRMEQVAAFKPYSSSKARLFAAGLCCTVVFAFTAVMKFSYPKYTPFDTIQLYNRTGQKVLAEDSDELREAVKIGRDKVYINRKKLDGILEKQNVEEEIVFLFWGGYMKMPGIGGGGDGIFVEYKEGEENLELPYISSDTDPASWLFKRL